MGKYLRVWVITLIFVLLVSSVAQGAVLGSRTLKMGSSGEDVTELQTLLKDLGFFKGTATGYYGSVTTSSVKSFQGAYGLTVDGIAGPNTIRKIQQESGTTGQSIVYTRLLKRGMSGTDVKNLQLALQKLGYFSSSLNATGYFGSQTEASVKSFQQSKGLLADGMAGRNTIAAVNKALAGESSGAAGTTYTVQKGDSLWMIAGKYGVTINQIQQANNLSSTMIYVGQKLIIPTGSSPVTDRGTTDRPTVTYSNYTVKSGDNLWSIAYDHGLQVNEVLKANQMTESSVIYAGQTIEIPVYHIPVKPTPGPQYGEYLDWWTEAQYVLPLNAVFTVTDFYTGTSFKAKRTYGASHADCEPLTAADTAVMLALWDKYHTSYWAVRPVIVHYNGRKLAASATAMLHAGVDSQPNGAQVSGRSAGYGYGPNYDAVKGNNANGVFDIHFLNSTRHKDGKVDWDHQANIKIAAGLN